MTVRSLPVELFKLRMPAEQPERAGPFKTFDYDRNRKFWRCRYQKMYVIIQADLHMVNGKPVFIGNINEDLFDLIFDGRGHPFVPVLCAPDDVVIDVIYAGPTMCIFRIVPFHANDYSANDYLIQYVGMLKLCTDDGKQAFITGLKTRVSSPKF